MELRIERGLPGDEELAAIVGVLLTRAAPVLAAEPPVSRWAAAGRPGTTLRDPHATTRPGPHAWRASTLPR